MAQGGRCIADGILILPPFYYAASTSEGLYEFFKAIIKVTFAPSLELPEGRDRGSVEEAL